MNGNLFRNTAIAINNQTEASIHNALENLLPEEYNMHRITGEKKQGMMSWSYVEDESKRGSAVIGVSMGYVAR